ncbi:hypothetical protein ES332_A10G047200v1 [Gossypium tomentosum]|uniref:Uncharacterized protein n=1 Tax=Gossypium tomentosum TaxID=34277 RepID=A0A5D2NNA0_GOSTO|nr:hypothetical protein ES332_A10G047200v1 [Gossypium tomentosum]
MQSPIVVLLLFAAFLLLLLLPSCLQVFKEVMGAGGGEAVQVEAPRVDWVLMGPSKFGYLQIYLLH